MRRCIACGATWTGPTWTCPACARQPAQRRGFLSFAPELDGDETDYSPELSRRLAALEPDSFWFRARNRLIAWAVERHFPAVGSLLEIGCGTGFVLWGLSRSLPQLELAGSDLLTAGLEPARERVPDVPLYQLDARRLPWREAWDVVGAFDVLEHIDEDEEVLTELHAATRPGGGLIITVPQHRWLWSGADDSARHKRRYTRRELVGKVERAGFEVERATSFVSVLLPAMAASRLRRGSRYRERDLEAELCCPPLLNSAFEATLACELALIRRGATFPAGGSLLLVARRGS